MSLEPRARDRMETNCLTAEPLCEDQRSLQLRTTKQVATTDVLGPFRFELVIC